MFVDFSGSHPGEFLTHARMRSYQQLLCLAE